MPHIESRCHDSAATDLARDILKTAQQDLLVSLRFLDVVCHRLNQHIVFHANPSGIDRQHLYCNPEDLIKGYQNDPRSASRLYLHMLLHGIFHHFSHRQLTNAFWHLACDMVTESVILKLDIPACRSPRDHSQRVALAPYEAALPTFTADHLFRHLLSHPPADPDRLATLFHRDHHLYWQDADALSNSGDTGEADRLLQSQAFDLLSAYQKEQPLNWEALTVEVDMAIEQMQGTLGTAAAAMKQHLSLLHPDAVDFDDFLRRFARLHDALQVDIDSFDPIFYTYGLNLYGRLPLIEPLETQEIEKIDEFVIAIDTSGSCSGEVVQAFLEKTCSLLKTRERFNHQINLYLFTCDCQIQDERHLTQLDDVQELLMQTPLKGFGGTDFRPVFARVAQLQEEGRLQHLRGLLYFTDGLGIYPKAVPPYDTGFVFLDQSPHLHDPDFPPWAMKVILSSDGLNVKSAASERRSL